MNKVSILPGLLYLGMILFGVFPKIIRSKILVFENDVNTSEIIRSSSFIFRLAFVSDLLMILFYLLTVLVLYILFRLINRNQSMLFLILSIVSAAIMSMNTINHIAIMEINSTDYLHTMNKNTINVLSHLFANFHKYGYLVANFFGGLCLLSIAIIIFESNIMPKYIGIMLIVATMGHFLEIFSTFLFPRDEIINIGLLFTIIGELSFCFWLLFKEIRI
jgi:uncharacterized membrane protein YesL